MPNMMEVAEFSLMNEQESVSLGRKQGVGNDKICSGPNVSRNHLKLVRYSKSLRFLYVLINRLQDWIYRELEDCEMEFGGSGWNGRNFCKPCQGGAKQET